MQVCGTAIAALAALLVLGCGGSNGTGTTEHAAPRLVKYHSKEFIFTEPEMAHGTGAKTVNLLARGFLPRDITEDRTFGYYAYLYFSNNGSLNASRRLAAANAFLKLLDDVDDLRSLNVDHQYMAVMLAPIKSVTRPRSASELLEEYDYGRAQLVAANLQRETLPSVAILVSEVPITAESGPRARVIWLCGDDAFVENTIVEFRTSLIADPNAVADRRYPFAERLRSLLDRVAAALPGAPPPPPSARCD